MDTQLNSSKSLVFPKYCKGIEGGAKNIIPGIFELEEGSMNHLIELLIRDSEEIEYLVDTSNHLSEVGTLFSKLHWLRIESMRHLGALYHGCLPASGHFAKLEDLYISDCPKLTCLFTVAVAQNLAQLEKLEMLSCPSLRHILTDDNREEISTDDHSHRLLFPKLKKLHVRECSKLEYIIPITFAQGLVQLECLEIVCNQELKYVFRQCTHRDQVAGQSENELKTELSALEELTLINLPNINSICPEDCYLTWPSLRQFSLQNCPEFFMVSINTCMALHNNLIINEASHLTVKNIKVRVNNSELEGIFQLAGLPIDEEQDPLKSCLETLYLENLPQLRYICKSDVESTSLQFQNLQQMEVSGCRRLKSIFSSCMAGDLPQLKELKIENCNQLDHIIEDMGTAIPSGAMHSDHSSKTDEGETSMAIEKKLVSIIIENSSKIEGIFYLKGFPVNGQQVTSWLEDLKLVNLPELMHIWMGAKHFVRLQHLHKLHICNCPKLKAIFSASILRILPLLKILVVEQCEKLEQIIEDNDENENVQNPQSPKVCFSQLKFLCVTHCNNLKHLFYISNSYEFPELEYLILNQDSCLVQVFKAEPGVKEGRVEVLFPKLKHVMLTQLPNLNNICQGIEFQTLTNLLVHNCPKLSLTPSTAVQDMLQTSDPESMDEPCLMNQQKPLGESSGISLSQTETDTDKGSEGHPIDSEDFVANDLTLIGLFQSQEEYSEGQIPTPSPCVSKVAAEHPSTKDNLVAKALVDLEESLKMPLKDIASSEANSLHLLTALNFLSHLPLEDIALTDGLKAIIESMHKEFLSILCSFKQAFATMDKCAMTEAHQNEVASTLASKISKAKDFLDEAQQKEAILKEQIIQLKKEIKGREADLSLLQEEKKKCIEETIRYKKEFENVSKDETQMVEDQRKARQELFEIDYKWSALCSQFQHNRIVAGNQS
ncbi:Leucine-rich repeat domain superfamily [Sesbania bispinosa]|nr:Leucine-rich repeat domain superfamily [Sesbania bispinosa]